MKRIKQTAAIMLTAASCMSLASCSSGGGSSSDSGAHDNSSLIVGEWYSEDIGGSMCFSEDNIFSLKIDVSDTFIIDSSGIIHIPGNEEDYSSDCSYDGTVFSFVIDNAIDMLTMTRRGEPDPDSVYGEYTLTSGILYDQFTAAYGDAGDRYGIIVGEDSLAAEITMSDYIVSGEKITLSGEDLSMFGFKGEGAGSFSYEINGDTLTLESHGETLTLSRNA